MKEISIRQSFSKLCLGLLLILMAGNLGCASLATPETSPETKVAILKVTGDYLNAVCRADIEAINSSILWADYLENREKQYSKKFYQRDLENLRNKFSTQNHPLINLDIKDLKIEKNTATITLQKFNQPTSPEIRISLLWDGNGWLISDDSLFGPGRLFGAKH